MVFWISFLVFLAGMLTYMLFPRPDLYQLHMTQEEGNIITFVNQHQAAKDHMYRVLEWNPNKAKGLGVSVPDSTIKNGGTVYDSHVYPFHYDDIDKNMPKGLISDVYNIEEKTKVNPDISVSNAGGSYTSALVCLANNPTPAYIGDKVLTTCPSNDQYIITYGYIPDWWTKHSHPNGIDQQAWFKALLKRTRGSMNCGLLTYRNLIDSAGRPLYSINNSQKYKGFTTIGGKNVIYPALTTTLVLAGMETCDEPGSCADKLADLFFCMTPFSNPYKGTPDFHWDVLNTTGIGATTGSVGSPLIGNFLPSTTQLNLTLKDNYTIAGVVSPFSGTTNTPFNLLGNLIKTTCDTTCSITAGNSTTAANNLTISSLPIQRGFSFAYKVTKDPSKQELTVYYTNSDNQFVKESVTGNTIPTSVENPEFLWTGDQKLNDIRVYFSGIGTYELKENAKVDKKRFGL